MKAIHDIQISLNILITNETAGFYFFLEKNKQILKIFLFQKIDVLFFVYHFKD